MIKIVPSIKLRSVEVLAVGFIMCFDLYFLSQAFGYRDKFGSLEFYSILGLSQVVVLLLCLRLCYLYAIRIASKELHTAAQDLHRTMELNNEVLGMLRDTALRIEEKTPRMKKEP